MLLFLHLRRRSGAERGDRHNRRYKYKREGKERRGVYGMLWKETPTKFAEEMSKDSPRASLHEAVAAA
jgi:hypothetical protein